MNDPLRSVAHYVPDDGRWYPAGMRVRIERALGAVDIIPDPNGDHAVESCRHGSSTSGSGDPVLRVELRKVGS